MGAENAPETQEILNAATQSIAEEIGATVVPVGAAWQAALQEDEPLELYDKDGSHPSAAGSQLAARVFVAILFETASDKRK